MKRPRKIGRTFVGASVILVALITAWWLYCNRFGYRVAQGITQGTLMKLRVGMPEAEVLKIVGPPLHPYRYPGTRIYAEPCSWCLDGVELYLNYKDGLLANAGAENYDLGFWGLRDQSGPVVWNQAEFVRFIKQ